MRFHEGQKEYFGKRGMSLHVVFFIKKNYTLHKQVYFTASYHCDQGPVNTLSIADIVLTKFLSDEPGVKNVYGKSDNALSYHANFSVEALYFLCKSKGIKLLRYDLNEPCCGKDQCNWEAAGAKSLIRSYVDARPWCTMCRGYLRCFAIRKWYGKFCKSCGTSKRKIGIKNSKSYKISIFWVWHSYGHVEILGHLQPRCCMEVPSSSFKQ